MLSPRSPVGARRCRLRGFGAFALAAGVCASALAQATAAGTEFRVTVTFTHSQRSPSVAAGGNGDFVVTWASASQDGGFYGIFARRFSAAGAPQGSEFQVNTYTPVDQTFPVVARAVGGDFVIAWQSLGQDGSGNGVFARRFNAAGVPQAGEIQVNAHTLAAQAVPAVGIDAEGDFVVTWQSTDQDGAGPGIFARRFNAAGVPQGSEFQVNTFFTSDQGAPAVAMGLSGDFIVAWNSFYQDGASHGVFARRFGAGGAPQSSEFQINTFTVGPQMFPALALNSDGDFVVAWQSFGQDGSENGVFARRFNFAGVPQAAEFRVNAYITSTQAQAAVSVDAAGAFVVTWESNLQDGSNYGVFGRRFDAAGVPQATEFQVNTYTATTQGVPAVAAAPAGDFVIAWQSTEQDGSSFGVFAQRFAVPKTLTFDIDGNGVGEPLTDGLLFLRYAFGFRGSTLITGAIAVNCARCTAAPVEGHLEGVTAASRVSRAGTEFQVSAYTIGDQTAPAVATEDNLDFVVVWESPHDGSGRGVFARRFESTGAPKAGEIQVNDYVTSNQDLSAVAADADGDFVVTWSSYTQDGSSYGVFARRFTSAGIAQAAEFRVNTYTTGYQTVPALDVDSDGDFVIAWQSLGQDGNNYGIFARRFNAAGAAQGAELQVNTYTTNHQRRPAVAMSGAGGFVVSWESELQDGASTGVFSRRFDATGVPQGAELQVNTYVTGAQSRPDVALDGDGDFVIAWHSAAQDGSGNGVFARRFDANGVPQAPELQVNTYTTGNQAAASVAIDGDGALDRHLGQLQSGRRRHRRSPTT